MAGFARTVADYRASRACTVASVARTVDRQQMESHISDRGWRI